MEPDHAGNGADSHGSVGGEWNLSCDLHGEDHDSGHFIDPDGRYGKYTGYARGIHVQIHLQH